jgi:hypothetical protein
VSAVAPGVAFVGRGRELDALAAHLAAQGRSAGGVLLISGPAGVGKTRLVDQAVRRATGLAVVRGYCPAETAPPLWPWRAAATRPACDPADKAEVYTWRNRRGSGRSSRRSHPASTARCPVTLRK